MTTQTVPLLTPSRVTAAPVLVWDCGKMPTKCGESAKVFRAEQAKKAASRQELYAATGLSSSGKSVSSEPVAPVQLPPGLKSQVCPTDHGSVAVAAGHYASGIPSPQAGQWE